MNDKGDYSQDRMNENSRDFETFAPEQGPQKPPKRGPPRTEVEEVNERSRTSGDPNYQEQVRSYHDSYSQIGRAKGTTDQEYKKLRRKIDGLMGGINKLSELNNLSELEDQIHLIEELKNEYEEKNSPQNYIEYVDEQLIIAYEIAQSVSIETGHEEKTRHYGNKIIEV